MRMIRKAAACDGCVGDGRLWLPVRRYRRLLATASRPRTDQATEEPGRARRMGQFCPVGRFPDMPGLTAYIHSLGLEGRNLHFARPMDLRGSGRFTAARGSRCPPVRRMGLRSAEVRLVLLHGSGQGGRLWQTFQEPYQKMGGILTGLDRDIVLNMCQYGKADVWKWGRQVGGNSWRTTGDLGVAPGDSLPGFYSIGFANAALNEDAGPGGWNDPDYILIGTVGDATKSSSRPENCAHHTTSNTAICRCGR